MTHKTKTSSVLIIGSGGAGLRAAIAADDAGKDVVVLGKRIRRDAHTILAAGGINAVLGSVDPEDTWQQHFVDTYVDGYSLATPRIVELLVKEAPDRVRELDDWGMPYARTPDGKIDQRYFGAHTYRRTCYGGDFTGRDILNTLVDQVEARDIPIHDHQYVSRILVDDSGSEPVAFGALAFNIQTGQRTVYLADSVILCAGGHTRIWRVSSSRRDENTGDAMRLALDAGCELADMELVQFHPSGMLAPEEIAGTLVTEAVRGEGGRLFNGLGERYMEKYDQERMELSTRDRVALASYTEIIEGRGTENGGVWLDISHKSKDFIIEKLPRMYRQFIEEQMLDISESPMEICPTAHYSMGGVVFDPDTCATRITGLYAAGECTAGLHGANRLGGNSLAEILVFGKRAGEAAVERSQSLEATKRSRAAITEAHAELDSLTKPGDKLARQMQRELRDLMTQHCGVLRTEESVEEGLAKLQALKKDAANVDVRPSSDGYIDLAYALDLLGAIAAAEATLLGAKERRESRGAHQRTDFPESSDAMLKNFITEYDSTGQMTITSREIPPVPAELQPTFDAYEELGVIGRLVE